MDLTRILTALRRFPGQTPPPFLGWVRALARHRLRAVTLARSAAVLVLEGRKTVYLGEGILKAPAGTLCLFPAQTGIVVENTPDPASGRYTALCLEFREEMIARVAAHAPPPQPAAAPPASWIVPRNTALDAALAHLLDMALACPGDIRVLDLCLESLLTLIAGRCAFFPLFWSAASSWRARCAGLAATDPGRAWTCSEMGGRLGVSERGLRRHLEAEGTSLRQVLRDVRLNTGLNLLQGGLPVGEAAFRSGYSSASRFAARFREQFGMSPSDVLRVAAPG